MKKIFYLAILLFLAACSLPHDNPLDPENNGVTPPSQITGITVERPISGYVPITWDSVPSADGYYIYRSQSYNGEYVLHKEMIGNEFQEYNDNENYTPGNFYFYILSAYKTVGDGKLEGPRSEKVTWD